MTDRQRRRSRARPGFRVLDLNVRPETADALERLADAHGVSTEVYAEYLLIDAIRRRLAVPRAR